MTTTPIIKPQPEICQAPAIEHRIFFDAGDIDHLIRRAVFPEWPSTDKMRNVRGGLEWLRSEDHAAELHLMTARLDNDLATVAYYTDYRRALDLVADILKWIFYSSAPAPKPGAYQPVNVEEVKTRADIVAVAERYTKLKKSGKLYTGLCPFHSEKHPSFVVYPDQGTWYCFGACGEGGDIISLVMKAEHCDFKTAVSILGR